MTSILYFSMIAWFHSIILMGIVLAIVIIHIIVGWFMRALRFVKVKRLFLFVILNGLIGWLMITWAVEHFQYPLTDCLIFCLFLLLFKDRHIYLSVRIWAEFINPPQPHLFVMGMAASNWLYSFPADVPFCIGVGLLLLFFHNDQ